MNSKLNTVEWFELFSWKEVFEEKNVKFEWSSDTWYVDRSRGLPNIRLKKSDDTTLGWIVFDKTWFGRNTFSFYVERDDETYKRVVTSRWLEVVFFKAYDLIDEVSAWLHDDDEDDRAFNEVLGLGKGSSEEENLETTNKTPDTH